MKSLIKLLISKKKLGFLKQLDLTKLNNAELKEICDLSKLIPKNISSMVTVKFEESSDLTKASNDDLHEICDYTKMTEEYIIRCVAHTNEKIINILDYYLSCYSFDDEFKLIEFENFSDEVQQYFLNKMFFTGSAEHIIILLDKIKSVNYGNSYYGDKVNPLHFSTQTNNFEMVKLLVEKYNADIDYSSNNHVPAIFISAQRGYLNITKYLYDRGAKIATSTNHIYGYSTKTIKSQIKIWEAEKLSQKETYLMQKHEKLKSDYNNLKLNNEMLQQSFEKLKSDYEMIKESNQRIKNLLVG